MKATKILFSFLMMGAFFVLFSCGGASSNSPSSTVKTFVDKMKNGEFEAAIACISLNGKEMDQESKAKLTGLMAMGKAQSDKKEGIKSLDILNEEIAADGNTAKVKVKFTYGNGETNEEEYKLVKENGKWLITIK